MEYPLSQPRSNHPPHTSTLLRQKSLLDPVVARSWVKNKLNTIPFTYSKYDEGMQAIKDQIKQDFIPKYHSRVMQAFYQEFYAIGVVSGETGERLWARWGANHRAQVEHCRRTSSIYTTEDIEDVTDQASASQNRRVAFGETSQSVDIARKRQIRTSLLVSEAEAKLLQNRDSNYWGDLAIPLLPQAAGKAKIVYIPPKSARNTVSIENQQPSIDPTILVRTLSRHQPNGSSRRNSLPTSTSLIDGSGTGAITKRIPIYSDALLSLAGVRVTTNLHAVVGNKNIPPPQFVDIREPYGDDFILPYSNFSLIAPISVPTSEDPHSRSEKSFQDGITHTSVDNTLGQGTEVPPKFTPDGTSSHSERSSPYTPITGGGGITKRREATALKLLNFPYLGGIHLSPSRNIGPAMSTDNSLGIHLEGIPLHEVSQGHGMLGTRSPVVSMMASPTNVSFVTGGEGGLYPIGNPRMTKRPIENLVPTTPTSREHSPLPFYEFPESSHSGSSGDSNNDLGASGGSPHQPTARGNYGWPPSNRNRRDLYLQNGMSAGAEGSYISKTPGVQVSPWHGNSPPPPNQYQLSPYDQIASNSAPVTRNNSTEISRVEQELNATISYPGVTPKLRSRFSFVLPNMYLGSRTAHNTRRRSSLQSPGLKVTREVLREEEEHVVGNPNRATFTAHVSRFGKDPMKEIHKAHTKYETKKPAFLKVIQDAVHDRIDFVRKASPKPYTQDAIFSKTSPKQYEKVNKLTISEPMHDGNPLKTSEGLFTSNVIKNATPIRGVARSDSILFRDLAKPGIVLQKLPPPNPKPRTIFMPWELDKTPMAADEFLSSGDEHESAMGIQQVGKTLLKAESQPTITIDAFSQGALYSWIECSVVLACSDFLKQQREHLDLDLLKKQVKKWKNSQVKLSTGETKPRDSPVEFMFGMEIQCKLLEGNHKTLHFSGPSAMNAVTVINAWKNIIPSFSPRTFCFPDYLILEHLRVTEKVLRLFGPAYWDSTVFETKRAQIVKRIMEAGQSRKAWSKAEKMAKLQRERRRAEASLLQAVGIMVDGGCPSGSSPQVIENEW